MRRIQIENKLNKKVEKFCNELFSLREFDLPKTLLTELSINPKNKLSGNEVAYINHLIQNYDRVIRAKPSEFDNLINEFDLFVHHTQITKSFHKKITKALRYEDLRSREYLEIIKDLAINACVYCNAQLTVVIDLRKIRRGKRKNTFIRKGNLEIDHFYPKSQYPFLSTSFYNLIPCCSNCNKSKSDELSQFWLYTEDNHLEPFKFSVDEDSLDKYLLSCKCDDLIIKFNSVDNNSDLLEKHKEHFRIEEIYSTQKDIAEELIQKSLAYTPAYKQNLVDTFGELFPDKAIINRLLIGNYAKASQIHKRPMSKISQDIARQLHLL